MNRTVNVEAIERERDQLLVVYRTLNRRHLGNLPLPSEELRLHVGARTTEANFLAQGAASSERVVALFGQEPAGPVLDWGCGSGRTWRWLQLFPAWRDAYHGVDVDAEAVEWLRGIGARNLKTCSDEPALPYDDGTFEGLFAFSVLTHIPPANHRHWYREIARVLRVGGRAFLTTQGERVVNEGRVPVSIADEYKSTGSAYATNEGHYKDAALVSEAFTRSAMEGVLNVLEYRSSGYQNMDVIIVRKER